jgi:hypothetical protein
VCPAMDKSAIGSTPVVILFTKRSRDDDADFGIVCGRSKVQIKRNKPKPKQTKNQKAKKKKKKKKTADIGFVWIAATHS